MWGINSEVIIPEKLVKLVPFKGSTTGKLDVFLDLTSNMVLDLWKLLSIITDGATGMVGSKFGFASLL